MSEPLAGAAQHAVRKTGSAPLAERRLQALDHACRQLEAVFTAHLLEQMRRSVPQSPLMPDSGAMRLMRGMFDEAVARHVSMQKGLGLARMMRAQLLERYRIQQTAETAQEHGAGKKAKVFPEGADTTISP